MWSSWVQGNFDGPLVPIENDVIPMFLLVKNKFPFTPSKNALIIIIMNIPHSTLANHTKQVRFYTK